MSQPSGERGKRIRLDSSHHKNRQLPVEYSVNSVEEWFETLTAISELKTHAHAVVRVAD